jgi:hydroxypyruvate isomerase
VQIADAPGRHQPGTGELPIAGWIEKIFATGYDGWVACEYNPEGPTAESFGWLEGLR